MPMIPRTSSIFASLNMAYYSWVIFQRHNCNDTNSILMFLTSVLLNFLLLKFQCLNTTPFNTHPKTTYVSLIAFLAYVMARTTQLRFSPWLRYWPTYGHVVEQFVLTFGFLAVVSLASLLFPDRARPVLYALCVVLLAGEPVFMAYRTIMVRRRRRLCAVRELFVCLPRIMAFCRRARRQLEILPA